MLPVQAVEYLSKMPEDEPVFILRARDVFTPGTIVCWAGMVGSVVTNDEEVKNLANRKAFLAMAIAEEMRNWQEENSVKIPD